MNTITDLSNFRIPGTCEAYYIPDFVTQDEEDYLIRKIHETPQQKWKHLANRRLQIWGGEITSKNVLLAQSMPSFISTHPGIISRLRASGAFKHSPHGEPNHVILNEYLPGQGIMPHEDGPTYYPAVATISLGSHAVFHYYQYLPDTSHPTLAVGEGKTIDTTPVHSILLEPRSLIITTATLYTTHLHGIQETEEDTVVHENKGDAPTLADLGVPIANWNMVSGQYARTVLEEGGVLRRGVRYSLTCRDVEKVMNVISIGRR